MRKIQNSLRLFKSLLADSKTNDFLAFREKARKQHLKKVSQEDFTVKLSDPFEGTTIIKSEGDNYLEKYIPSWYTSVKKYLKLILLIAFTTSAIITALGVKNYFYPTKKEEQPKEKTTRVILVENST